MAFETLRVCHIITRMIVGGAQQNTLYSLIDQHNRKDIEVSLITGLSGTDEGTLLPECEKAGLRVLVVPSLVRNISPIKDYLAYKKITRLLKTLKPDIVHTHTSKAGIIGRLAAARANVRWIVHGNHGLPFNASNPAWKNWLFHSLEKRAARVTDRFICVCETMKQQALAAELGSEDQYDVVYSGMEIGEFINAEEHRVAERGRLQIGPDAPVLITIGRLIKHKGQHNIIATLKEIAQAVPDVKLLLVGGGPDEAEFKALADTCGVADRCVWTGHVAPERIPKLLAAADLMVHCSVWEGLPRVAVQALLARRSVVAYQADGIGEMVQPEVSGILVQPGDNAALAAGCVKLLKDGALREQYAAAGQARCKKYYDWKLMGEQIYGIYRKMVSQYKGKV
ncbi:MAG TPA: glycosyltransferase family 4 protein [Planctomycetota bacterium]|nr:glycosyltransferase family 4 protein [Planctomycetota bacterium]